MNNKLDTVLSGVSGEYFVAAELSKRGLIASITLRNTKGVDIVCSNSDASKSVAIQVKTNRRSDRSWILSEKAENNASTNFYYVFVSLNTEDDSHPEYFIVPSKVVASYCKKSHAKWLATPGLNGRKRNDTTMRKYDDPDEKYLSNWEILNL